jgi:hypothetical protein
LIINQYGSSSHASPIRHGTRLTGSWSVRLEDLKLTWFIVVLRLGIRNLREILPH